MSQDDRLDRLHELLGKVRAAASERGIELPKDLPTGSLAETLRQRRASQPDDAPVAAWDAPSPAAPLTAFTQSDVASEPLALVQAPLGQAPLELGPLESEPSSVTRLAQVPRQLIQFSGHFDEEETSTGNVDEIERIALEEERLARERDEAEILQSGLLDDEVELVDDDELELLDDEDATTEPPGPTPAAIAYAAAPLSSSPPDVGRPTLAHDPSFDDVQYEAESVRPESRGDEEAPASRRPLELADDFERAVASFAERQSQRAAAPLELENLEEELSRPPPAGSAPPAPAILPLAAPAFPALEPPPVVAPFEPPPPPFEPPPVLEPPPVVAPPPRFEPPPEPPPVLEPPPVVAPPPRFEPPRFEPPPLVPPPPRFEPPRFEPPRFEPPRFEPPRFEPPRFKAPPESSEPSIERPADLADEAPATQAMPDVDALESAALETPRPPLESAPFPISDEVSAERPRGVSEPPFDLAEDPSPLLDEAEPLLDEAPESSRRPVAFGEPADPELSMGPPESGEVESQPYPRGTAESADAESSAAALGGDAHPLDDDDDDGGPATMHRMAFDDGDAPTPKPLHRGLPPPVALPIETSPADEPTGAEPPADEPPSEELHADEASPLAGPIEAPPIIDEPPSHEPPADEASQLDEEDPPTPPPPPPPISADAAAIESGRRETLGTSAAEPTVDAHPAPPAQIPETPAAALEVAIVARPAESATVHVDVVAPRPAPAPTTFGAILDRALALLPSRD